MVRGKRSSAAQKGQAIVLIALVLVVMIGLVGLSVDSGRAYLERRQLQNATDAAALGAGDAQENYANVTGKSIPQAVLSYAMNERIPSTPDASVQNNTTVTAAGGNIYNQVIYTAGWGITACGGTAVYNSTLNRCVDPTGHVIVITATNTQFNGYTFDVVATHSYKLAFLQVFGISNLVPIAAEATAIVGNQRQQPALLALGNGGCTGTNADLTMSGGGTLTVLGDVYTNGCASVDSNLNIAGNAYWATTTGTAPHFYCYNSVPGFVPYPPPCNVGDVTGSPTSGVPPLPDPGYLTPSVSGTSTVTSKGTWYEVTPGSWDPEHITDSNCYFMDPGVYGGDFSNQGSGLISNELKPPDEPSYLDPNSPVSTGAQFWNIRSAGSGSCAGDFSLSSGSGTLPGGNYGVEITAVRSETTGGSCTSSSPCIRESAPSVCKQINPVANSSIKVNININSPGAQSYNVYVDPNGCENITNPYTTLSVDLANDTSYSTLSVNSMPKPKPAGQLFVLGGGAGQVVQLSQAASTGDTTLHVVPFTTSSAYVAGTGLKQEVNFDKQALFGFAGNFAAPYYGGLPSVLGGGTSTFDNTSFPGGVNSITGHTASCAAKTSNTAASGLYCMPPDSLASPFCFANCSGTVAQENPPRRLDPSSGTGGDLANENACSPKGTDANNPCGAADTTPGAIQLFMKRVGTQNQCLTQNAGASSYMFSGYQYDWIVIYIDGPSASTPAADQDSCTVNLAGGANTAFIGTVYAPLASIKIAGSSRSPVSGQVIVFNASIQGSSAAGIDFNPLYAPAPPAARLVY